MPSAPDRTHIRIVQSRQNRRVKELRACFARGGHAANGRIGIEGEHLLQEALRSDLKLITLFVREGNRPLLRGLELPAGVEILELPTEIFASAVPTESPQGIAAIAKTREFCLDQMVRVADPLIIVTDGLQDPGNLGTLVRSAEAFGGTGVIGFSGTVSIWNSKALRASSGSAFRVPVVSSTLQEGVEFLRSAGIRILVAVSGDGLPVSGVDLTGPTAVVIGNEGSGISEPVLRQADERITIPYPGRVESLNAAMAGTILLYEAARQRAG